MQVFEDITSNSEFFRRNPNKQAGEEKPTTSRAFPFTIVATKEDVLQMFSFLYQDDSTKDDILIIEAEAEAKLKLLKLLKL